MLFSHFVMIKNLVCSRVLAYSCEYRISYRTAALKLVFLNQIVGL